MNRSVSGVGMTSQRTRSRMIERLREQGIRNERVLTAIAAVPRHLFVEEALASRAYEDTALPLGFSQTISQPYIVARMIEVLRSGRELGKTLDRKSTRLNSSHANISYAVFCLTKQHVPRGSPLLRRRTTPHNNSEHTRARN